MHWPARILGLHGLAIALVPTLFQADSWQLPVIAAGTVLLPWLGWAFGPPNLRINASFSYGIVPGAFFLSMIIAETASRPLDAIDALRIVAGLVAMLAAIYVVDRPETREVELEQSSELVSSARVVAERSLRRATLLSSISLALVAILIIAPFEASEESIASRSFAVVCATVFGATVLLTTLPLASKKTSARRRSARSRMLRAAALIAFACCVFALEYFSRP